MQPEGTRSFSHYLPCLATGETDSNTPNNIRINVDHDSNRQCFSLAVSPVRIKDGSMSVPLSAFKFAILGAGRGSEKRFNLKKLQAMSTMVEHQIVTFDQHAQVWTLINQILAENNLTLDIATV